MEVVKTLPQSAVVLSPSTRLYYWFMANRLRIGAALLTITAAVSTSLEPGDEKTRKWLHTVEVLVMLSTGAVAGGFIGGAKFKSDSYHKDRMFEEIREKSAPGLYSAVTPPPRTKAEIDAYTAGLARALGDGERFDTAHEQAMEKVRKLREGA